MNDHQKRITGMQQQLAAHRHTLAALDALIPQALTHLATAANGWPTGPHSGNHGTHSIADPVGNAIARTSHLLELDHQLRLTWVILTESANTTHRLLHQITHGTTTTPPPTTCTATTTMPGATTWAHNLNGPCESHIHADHLCAAHYAARRRWLITLKTPK